MTKNEIRNLCEKLGINPDPNVVCRRIMEYPAKSKDFTVYEVQEAVWTKSGVPEWRVMTYVHAMSLKRVPARFPNWQTAERFIENPEYFGVHSSSLYMYREFPSEMVKPFAVGESKNRTGKHCTDGAAPEHKRKPEEKFHKTLDSMFETQESFMSK